MMFMNAWVLFLIPPAIGLWWLAERGERPAGLRFSSVEDMRRIRPCARVIAARRIGVLRAVALVLMLCALARPRTPLDSARVFSEGVDIVLAVDCSGSMRAEDFTIGGTRYNRLAVVKRVVQDFIRRRHADRIGLIAFAARAYTVCPPTLDYDWLIENLNRVDIGDIEDGTAIGSAIGSALNRLKGSPARSKVVILLTDGMNNVGKISPLTAAEAAQALSVKIYTVGVGSRGLVPYPVTDMFGRTVYQNVQIDIDEETLGKIAERTGARYFRATDTASLAHIYAQIDGLEKTRFEESGFREYRELFFLFLVPALALVAFEALLRNTFLRQLP